MLNNTDKKNPFKVPENYFEDFHASMMSKIAKEPKAKVVPLWRKVIPWASVAAVLGGVIISVGILTNNSDVRLAGNNNMADTVLSNGQMSSDEDDFFLFLEDEVVKDSYYNLLVSQ